MTFTESALEWLSRFTGISARFIEVEPLMGATSSSVLRVQHAGSRQGRRFVLRVLDNREWFEEEPDLAEHEAAALQEVERATLQGPALVAHATKEAGFGWPVVLMSYVKGRVVLSPTDFVHLEA